MCGCTIFGAAAHFVSRCVFSVLAIIMQQRVAGNGPIPLCAPQDRHRHVHRRRRLRHHGGRLYWPPHPERLGSHHWRLRVTPNLLIGTYLVLTFAELFLSPMGISFVSKVAPPKCKGLMMGGWFVATAVGNYMVSIIGMLWGGLPLWVLWGILVVLCLISALFIFSIMKKLESATA